MKTIEPLPLLGTKTEDIINKINELIENGQNCKECKCCACKKS